MTPPRVLKQDDGLGGVCAAHGQFEARIDDKFDDLKATMTEAVTELKAVNKSLSDGRVEFKSHEGRLLALEKTTVDCAVERKTMKTDIQFLTRGYWIAVGALSALQIILKLWK
jgi:hypothetical protein